MPLNLVVGPLVNLFTRLQIPLHLGIYILLTLMSQKTTALLGYENVNWYRISSSFAF